MERIKASTAWWRVVICLSALFLSEYFWENLIRTLWTPGYAIANMIILRYTNWTVRRSVKIDSHNCAGKVSWSNGSRDHDIDILIIGLVMLLERKIVTWRSNECISYPVRTYSTHFVSKHNWELLWCWLTCSILCQSRLTSQFWSFREHNHVILNEINGSYRYCPFFFPLLFPEYCVTSYRGLR